MNMLIIHSADLFTVKRVNKWRKNKKGLGNIYQLSLVGDINSFLEKDEDFKYLKNQIKTAAKIYKVDKVILLDNSNQGKATVKELQKQINELTFEIQLISQGG